MDASVGSGTVTLSLGAAQFPPITLDPDEATLTGLRDAINAAGLNVRASILDQGEAAGKNRYRLVLNSQAWGTEGAMTVDFDLSGGTAPALVDLTAAQDACVTLGTGVAAVDVWSRSNSVTTVLPGVTLQLLKADPDQPVQVEVASDPAAVRSAVEGFLAQYNQMAAFFTEQFHFDPATGSSGTLFGDSTLMSLQSNLANEASNSRYVQGSFSALAAIGIQLDDSGRLVIVDQAAFSDALESPEDLKKLFTDPDHGVAVKLKLVIQSATDVVTGTVTTQEQSLENRLEDLRKDRLAVLQRLDRVEANLRSRFVAMESALAALQSQSRQLEAMVFGSSSSSSSSISSNGGG